MEPKVQYTETQNLVADIRNKLTPFWNLVVIIRSGDYPKFDIDKEAQIAYDNEMIILKDLDAILVEAERLEDENKELINDVNQVLGIENPNNRVYDRELPNYGYLMTIEKWKDAVEEGYIMDDDGNWVKDGMMSRFDPFSSEQEDATHVMWFNK